MALQEEIQSKKAFRVKGPVSLGIKAGDYIYLSMQLPFDPKTKEIISDDFCEQAERCMKNIELLLNELGLSSEYILKATVYLTDMKNYDALNEVYGRHVKAPYPARVCIGVNELPFGAKVGIEAFAVDTRALEVIIANEDRLLCEAGYCSIE
ncbi:MAG: Rid family detoxifying hydrolase [Solobacterium sp.]|nr:Rid family detoxifying hydrolase [Solobacterium sp.]